MAYSADFTKVKGVFTEKEYKHQFEYELAETPIEFDGRVYDKMVYVGLNGEKRYANIMKTISYIIVDESDCDVYKVQRWEITKHRRY